MARRHFLDARPHGEGGQMKGAWPKLAVAVEMPFQATHILPQWGIEPHPHSYLVRAGGVHEINPTAGYGLSKQSMRQDLEGLICLLRDQHLNDVVAPFQPTVEILACWLMARLPPYFSFVEIQAHGDFWVRAEAGTMRDEWAARFRK